MELGYGIIVDSFDAFDYVTNEATEVINTTQTQDGIIVFGLFTGEAIERINGHPGVVNTSRMPGLDPGGLSDFAKVGIGAAVLGIGYYAAKRR